MIFDCHLHLFSQRIISNVSRKKELVERLSLKTQGAENRLGIEALAESMKQAGVEAGLMLPTAGPSDVEKVNREFIETAAGKPYLFTAGTLHPDHPKLLEELKNLQKYKVRGIKMCSFSQGFRLDSPSALALFDIVEQHNRKSPHRFFVILDTFYLADRYFGTDPKYTTTPEKFSRIVRKHPEINFIAAHMAGLTAPFEAICKHLTPSDNLYLDTSNAAHTLSRDQFVDLLKSHGPSHILFGTDWPWFVHKDEVAMIQDLTTAAGFSSKDKKAVFYENIASLLGI
jgi:uncharacterized protein